MEQRVSEYSPPLQDIRFLLESVLDYGRLFSLPRYSHADPDLAQAVLEEAARFSSEVLAPINARGDEEGARLENGLVVMPSGFREAYRKFAAGGWPGLDMPLHVGGQELPLAVQAAYAEMINGACVSFGMLPIMQRGATQVLLAHADAHVVDTFAPRLVAGEWGATICISEPQAGSDVGRIRTRAVRRVDGTYGVSGTKIFITYGDQDFTPQIAHMVLARTPDAPAGTQGLSLFVVPKRLVAAGGTLGDSNRVSVGRVEHKMGLRASPTCVLNFDDATAYLVGEECAGIKAMFVMMNTMRLEVAVQGVGIAGAAAARATSYALERLQGGQTARPPLRLVEHADIRRMLLAMHARTEAMRALVLEAALQLDFSGAAHEPQDRANALALAEWLLPVCKACGSETGFDVASLALQIFGGHGYVCDAGVEQYLRDARIMSIYEGTNGIQALDLVLRKLAQDGGRRYRLFAGRVRHDLEITEGRPEVAVIHATLRRAMERLESCTATLARRLDVSSRDAEAGASAYLSLVGLVGGAWMWLRMAAVPGDAPLNQRKRALARYYAEYLMPQAHGLAEQAVAGAGAVDQLEAEMIAAR